MSINKVIISGNLTRDPELRQTTGGKSVTTFGIAVNDRRRNPQTGEWEDRPNFFDCVVFGNRAEPLSRMLHKGMKVCVEGKLRHTTWEKDGQRRSKVDVSVDECEFMSQRQPEDARGHEQTSGQQVPESYYEGSQSGPQRPMEYYPQPQALNADVYASDDIPFRKAVAR